ncbi:DUF4142 domain-containing protein [Pedobacter sp. BAL39]|uniref:DUF4142 domain-containing protein n=1 Tax=Pedobacter sp. BAL39 TaxID=391596 RepID=UPI00030C1917|nr:DUF4142 domain-containing protein [Pedobacter sp. BAL39]
MKNYVKLAFCAAAFMALQSCQNSERKDRDDPATVQADTALDTTLRAQAATADVDLTGNEKSFLLNAAVTGMTQISAARMIIGKTKRPEIKSLAEMMIKDHTKMATDLSLIANGKGMSLPEALPQSKRDELSRLETLTADELDKKYLVMLINEHRTAVDLFDRATTYENADVKQFAAKALPALKAHQKQAEDLGLKLNISNAGNGDNDDGVAPDVKK